MARCIPLEDRPKRFLFGIMAERGLGKAELGAMVYPRKPNAGRSCVRNCLAGHWPGPDAIKALAKALDLDPVEFYR